MRGKAPLRTAHSISRRITPAYAGKSSRPLRPPECRKDHPRVCGEKAAILRAVCVPIGSPPRMRGKAGPNSAHNAASGITPAYAGKSSNVPSAFRCGRDHPRVCGEKAFVRSCCASRTGSPPRMRGKVCTYSATEHGYGITPAYAGKSRPDPEPDAGTGDHPRVCGEKSMDFSSSFTSKGSPPRMRGKVNLSIPTRSCQGITPAYAGKR